MGSAICGAWVLLNSQDSHPANTMGRDEPGVGFPFFRLWVGDVAGHCLQLSRAVASMGVDWCWILGILSSIVTGN